MTIESSATPHIAISPMTVGVTGASGLVGVALSVCLRAAGVPIRRFVRRSADAEPTDILWDPFAGVADPSVLDTLDAVVHLAGAPIAGRRWSAAYKREIRDSRVVATRGLCEQLAARPRPPRTLICASAVGYYGDRGDELLDESADPGAGFLADICREWEDATRVASDAGLRVVRLRIGMVLAKEGGALAMMLPWFRAGLGGPLGSGRQYVSWISLHDLVRLIVFALTRDDCAGALNAVAPQPVTNREFAETLARACGRRPFWAAPALALRLSMGEMAESLLLSGARVTPKRATDLGFAFDHSTLADALDAVIRK